MINLPEEIKTILEKSRKEYIKITCDNTKKLDIFNSKFGGNPYFPKDGYEYPLDNDNKPMRLLAQINFEEIPFLDKLPRKGILQMYIKVSDDYLYGLDFEDGRNKDGFRVIFFDTIEIDKTKLLNDFGFVNKEYEFPIEDEIGLDFLLHSEVVSCGDYQFDKIFGKSMFELEDKYGNCVEKFYDENGYGDGHKIGGYAYFTQEDPRVYDDRYKEYNYLLLQIDTDDDYNIVWGDCGVANFFINEEKLAKHDFSDILYNWDCC